MYFRFPLSGSFQQCPLLILSPVTDAVKTLRLTQWLLSVRCKSELGTNMVNYTNKNVTVRFISKLQHSVTWSAAACPPHLSCCHPAVFFHHLRRFHSLKEKYRERIKNRFAFLFLFLFQNCVTRYSVG